MKSYPALRRVLAFGLTVLSITIVVGIVLTLQNNPSQSQPSPKKGEYPWPLFGGTIQRNLVNLTDRNISFNFQIDDPFTPDKKETKGIKWSVNLGSRSYGGPVIAEGKVFVGTNNEQPRDPKFKGIDMGVVMCFRESDGKFLWQNAYPKLKSGRVNDWPLEGICSSPVVENGKLYYVGNRCEVICDETATGKNVWKLDMMEELDVFPHNLATCSPLIVGDMLFVCTSNGVDKDHINIPAPKAPSFIAVNKNTGKVVWKNNDPSKNLLDIPAGANTENYIKKLVNTGKLLMHGQWANPAYAEVNGVGQIIFPGGDGWLRAFEPNTGKLLWKFDCNPKDSIYELGGKGTRNDFVNTPVIADNKLYIGVGQDPEHDEGVGHFWCVDLAKATKFGKTNKENDVTWKDNNFDPDAPVNSKSALAWHYGGVPSKEEERIPGRPYVFGRTLSTACVHDGLVFVADLEGYVYCLDAKTGKRYWYDNLRTPIWSSPYFVDGKILMGTDDQFLYVYEHGRKKNLIAEVEIFGKVRATPVVANGTLFVMTENKLYAIR